MAESEFGTFFIPGPTEIRPEILEQITRPVIPHRGKPFEAMFARIEAGLRDVLLTARPVYVGATSATGFMEMAIRNVPDGTILSLVNGAFSERFAAIAESCGRSVVRIVVPWGEAFDLDAIEDALATRRFVALTVAHCETSTGVLTDPRAIAELAHRYGVMALVDSVSAAGGAELMVDAWQLDFLLTGSQKALALPAGLAFAVASPEYVERAKSVANRGFYFDVLQYEKYAAKHQTPSTPATNLLYAVEAQVGDIGREGIERRWERHIAMRDATIAWVDEVRARRNVELSIVAPEGSRSPTVTVVRVPAGMSTTDLRQSITQRGYTIGGGYGELAATTIRIGHMGDHTLEGLVGCLAVVAEALATASSGASRER